MKKYFHFRGKKVNYSDKGSGPAVVLIHGYLETAEVWKDFSLRLSGNFRLIAVDLPGHGHSDVYSNSHSMEFLAEVICGLLDALSIQKAFITGHSLGGYVALAFVEKFPSRLTGYCLFHSHPFADTAEAIQKREREISVVKAGKKFLMYPENVKRMFAGSNTELFREQHEGIKKAAAGISEAGIIAVLNGMMSRPSRIRIMEEGKVPCLWILGKMDNYIPFESMKERVKLPPNASLLILEKSGHLGFIEEKEKSAAELADFILKVSENI